MEIYNYGRFQQKKIYMRKNLSETPDKFFLCGETSKPQITQGGKSFSWNLEIEKIPKASSNREFSRFLQNFLVKKTEVDRREMFNGKRIYFPTIEVLKKFLCEEENDDKMLK